MDTILWLFFFSQTVQRSWKGFCITISAWTDDYLFFFLHCTLFLKGYFNDCPTDHCSIIIIISTGFKSEINIVHPLTHTLIILVAFQLAQFSRLPPLASLTFTYWLLRRYRETFIIPWLSDNWFQTGVWHTKGRQLSAFLGIGNIVLCYCFDTWKLKHSGKQ